jgi:hypothetical protein
MPRGDRSGPMGMGPRSGRAAGYCASNDTPGFMNRFFGRGFGRGSGIGYGQGFGNSGGGFGWRNIYRNTGLPGWMRRGRFSADQPISDAGAEKQLLENQVEILKSQLDQIQNRLSKLDSTASDA